MAQQQRRTEGGLLGHNAVAEEAKLLNAAEAGHGAYVPFVEAHHVLDEPW